MSNIPVIDMIFLILIVLMVIRVYFRGFIVEVFSWATLIVSIWGAVLLHSAGAAIIRNRIMQNVEFIPEVIAFGAVFIVIMLFFKMLEHILKDVVTGAKLGGVNKFLGAIFGLVEGLTLVALILFVLTIQPLFDATNIILNSIFAEILLPIIRIPFDRGVGIADTVLLLIRAFKAA